MRRRVLLSLLAMVTVAAGVGHVLTTHAQAPSLVLNPASGPAPLVTGTLSGGGWCADNRGVEVSGAGVAGTAAVGRAGELGGNFEVRGAPGESVFVVVTAACPDGDLTARAEFRFDAEPTPTPTPTRPAPTPTPTEATPTPTPTRLVEPTATNTPSPAATPTRPAGPSPTPSSTPTPTPTRPAVATSTPTPTPATVATPPPLPTPPPVPVPQPGQGRVTVTGCVPSASEVSVKLFAADAPSGAAAFTLPAVQTPNPQVFLFDLPTGVPPGALFKTEVEVKGCPAGPGGGDYIMPAGGAPPSLVAALGKTTLEESSIGNLIPAGGFGEWVTYRQVGGQVHSIKQLFRWATDAPGSSRGTWQLSLQPFANNGEPLDSPAGLLASGEVVCAGCQFTVDLGKVFPAPSATKEAPPTAWQQSVVGGLFEPAGKLAQGFAPKAQTPAQASVSNSPVQTAGAVYTGLPTPLKLYFRIVPRTAQGLVAGPASNTAILEWTGVQSDPIKISIVDCKTNPTHPSCPPPPPLPEYTLQILEYHGYVQAVSGHEGCFVVLENSVGTIGGLFAVNYKKGQVLCPPEPEEPGLLEQIASFITDAVDWVSNAYADLKSEVISLVGKVVPASICPPSCLSTALDLALVAAGVPPSLPNFEQLTEQGLDYIAEEAVAQAGLPPGLHDLAKDEFKKGMKAGIEAAKYAYADSASWLPAGVPLKPDPQGALQPASLRFKVTRMGSSPGKCTIGPITIDGWPGKVVPSATETQAQKSTEEMKKLPWGMFYRGLQTPAPELKPGESMEWTVAFEPALSYGYPGAKYYTYHHALNGWSSVYYYRNVHLRAFAGCANTVETEVPAHGP